MNCADCGAAIEDGSELCMECGSPVRRKADSSTGSYGAAARVRKPTPPPAPASTPLSTPKPAATSTSNSAYDDLIAEALASIEEVEPKNAPQPAAVVAAPTATAAPPLKAAAPVARRPVRNEEPERIRCPACGSPSTRTRCPIDGTVLRKEED